MESPEYENWFGLAGEHLGVQISKEGVRRFGWINGLLALQSGIMEMIYKIYEATS